uniref:Uncharacterized protein n=1 Tax=Spongospora subterranea TaxID=70186 RepID=A0A0H5RAD3_9EUKA|eukprot:CRZ10627.1 hypothetical protein [Spongospora subterranea]
MADNHDVEHIRSREKLFLQFFDLFDQLRLLRQQFHGLIARGFLCMAKERYKGRMVLPDLNASDSPSITYPGHSDTNTKGSHSSELRQRKNNAIISKNHTQVAQGNNWQTMVSCFSQAVKLAMDMASVEIALFHVQKQFDKDNGNLIGE